MQIAPTILEKDFNIAREKILKVKNLVEWIQLDVIDGQFTSGKTFELELINKMEGIENVLWETHLMVKDPIKWIEKSIFVNTSRIIGHVEMMSDRKEFVKKVKDQGVEVGLAFDVDTKIDDIPQETDLILLMSRKVGFGNFPFDERIYGRIKKAVEIRQKIGSNFVIGIDGGVNETNIKKLQEAGAEIGYCGSAVFNGNVKDNLERLNNVGKN
jgi:ribulose-phosphate 3-epimerase